MSVEAPRPLSRAVLLPWAVLLVAIVVAHWSAIRGMIDLWGRAPMYSYGYLVPLIAAYMAWSRRAELASAPVRPVYWAGGLLLGIWALMMLAGRLAGLQVLQQLALLPAAAAVIVLAGGAAHLRIAWAPVAYLLLMIPIWDVFTERLHVPFQNVSASIGARLLQALGIPAFHEGTFIALPNILIEVARACSGVNYLVAVIALGLPLGYLFLRTWWRRVVLLVVAVAVAALSNGLRVALICALSYWEVGSPLHGPMHVLHGLFVAGIGHVALFIGLWWLGRAEARRLPPRPAAPAMPAIAPPPMRLIATLAAVFVAVGLVAQVYRPRPVPLAGSLESMPVVFGDWVADAFVAPVPVDWWKNADATLTRRYRTSDGATADVHVAYFAVQEQSREIVTYQSGPLHREAQHGALRLDDAAVTVNVAREQEEQSHRLVAFWYEVDGTVESDPYATKLRTLWHGIRRGHTNGAVVMLTMSLPAAEADPRRRDALLGLAARVHAALGTILPGRAGAPAAAPAAARPPLEPKATS